MGKLKWNWLTKVKFWDENDSFDRNMSYLMTGIVGFVFSLIACVIVQGGILGTAGPDLVTLFVVALFTLGTPFFLAKAPRLHYLYGLNGSQKKAVEWYESLTDKEKKQLPNGWKQLILDTDEYETIPHKYDYVKSRYVIDEMYKSANEVIRLYRQKNIVPKVPDYRIETYLELMAERKKELKTDIEDEKAIQDKIARMP